MKFSSRKLAAPFIVSLGMLPACGSAPTHSENPPGPEPDHEGGHMNPPGVESAHENPPAPEPEHTENPPGPVEEEHGNPPAPPAPDEPTEDDVE